MFLAHNYFVLLCLACLDLSSGESFDCIVDLKSKLESPYTSQGKDEERDAKFESIRTCTSSFRIKTSDTSAYYIFVIPQNSKTYADISGVSGKTTFTCPSFLMTCTYRGGMFPNACSGNLRVDMSHPSNMYEGWRNPIESHDEYPVALYGFKVFRGKSIPNGGTMFPVPDSVIQMKVKLGRNDEPLSEEFKLFEGNCLGLSQHQAFREPDDFYFPESPPEDPPQPPDSETSKDSPFKGDVVKWEKLNAKKAKKEVVPPGQPPATGGGGGVFWWIVLLVLLLCVGGGGLYFVRRRQRLMEEEETLRREADLG